MDFWIISAIITIFVSGFHNFTLKIAAERNYDVSIINFYSYLIWIILVCIYVLWNFNNIDFSNIYIIWLLAFWNALFFFFSMFSRVEAMKNVDTVIFFPLYKTFGPILITFISIFFFRETLEFKEIIWIIIWISVPLLLITNSENKRQKNLLLWVILILVTSILTAVSSSISKEIMIKDFDVSLFLLINSIFGLIFSVISYKFLKKRKKIYNEKWVIKLSIISWFFHLLSFLFFILALKWNLAIVFTICSFAILIPIILSVIFYKDHFDFKKWLVIALSIISIILFI